MMKQIFVSHVLAIFFAVPVAQLNIGWGTPTAFTAESETEQAKESGISTADEKKARHGDMKEDKGYEGMHGMRGHDMKGWWSVIGVVMVIMMGAHVAVLF